MRNNQSENASIWHVGMVGPDSTIGHKKECIRISCLDGTLRLVGVSYYYKRSSLYGIRSSKVDKCLFFSHFSKMHEE